ncbi:DUF4064 domain-containing protein [Amphibacillus cookii]|uniref:DUF4064 domain-containing protein n=1 Tax=Amphibacillus cookii TaxID=767787 RepID=UPI00195A54E9|nr:DUF4064 domain-containing protein [Amphibacillus cookii]MBM7542959.1 heme/copper-type cytochrome/quinol oxidase subunit 2 [Amphibacillus cookii]
MINRKVEMALIVIGSIIFIFFGIAGINVLRSLSDEAVMTDVHSGFIEDVEDTEMLSLTEFTEALRMNSILMIAIAVIAIVTGLLAIKMLKENRRPKPAGILLLVVGGLTSFLQMGFAMFGSLLFVIAGMMALVKKPKDQPSH